MRGYLCPFDIRRPAFDAVRFASGIKLAALLLALRSLGPKGFGPICAASDASVTPRRGGAKLLPCGLRAYVHPLATTVCGQRALAVPLSEPHVNTRTLFYYAAFLLSCSFLTPVFSYLTSFLTAKKK